jgi:hypothetical protein
MSRFPIRDSVMARIQASDLGHSEKAEALGKLPRATLAELEILWGVFEIKDTWRRAGEIFRGAHLRIFDQGARYDDWRKIPTARTRRSSHASDGAQFHVDGPLVHTVLFGRIGNFTWLQLEGAPQGLAHVADFFKYKFTGKNQGPYGSSPHVDSRPIQVQELRPHTTVWEWEKAQEIRTGKNGGTGKRPSDWVYQPPQPRGSVFR